AGLTPSVARAICNPDTCNYGDEKPPPPPPPKPVVTAIGSISPGYGWGGDLVTLTGTGFTGATVTFGGVAVTIVSATSTQIVFVVPTLPSVAGPMIETVVVSSSKGTASTTFAD